MEKKEMDMTTQKQEWPKTLYCTHQEGDDGPYILAGSRPQGIAEPNKKIPVAVYQLVGISTIETSVVVPVE